MIFADLNSWFRGYEGAVKNGKADATEVLKNDIVYWKNQLFKKFLIYCFPVSLVALVPCLYISFAEHYPEVAFFDLFCFLILSLATFASNLSLRSRKLLVIGTFYSLSVFLITKIGYVGPGVFYLFAITILTALIFDIKFAYYSIIANFLVLAGFAFCIYIKVHGLVISNQYSAGEWIASSSNLIFLSIVLVVLIHKMFDWLQQIILKKEKLKFQYKSIFQSSPLSMWLFDANSLEFIDVNDAAVEHYGYSRAEFLQMTIKDIRPIDDSLKIEQIVKLNKHSLKFNDNSFVHLKKNGEKINVKIESTLLDFNGRHAKLVLITDITVQLKNENEMIRANKRLQQSESNLRAIFESTNDGFILLDKENIVVSFSCKAKDFISLNNSLIELKAQRNIFDFIDETEKDFFTDVLVKVHSGEAVQYDKQYFLNGRRRWLHFMITPVNSERGINGACITGRDITARKTYVKTIERQNKIFREISWIQSHLVRAPLARVMGLTALLSSEADEHEKGEILKLLQFSADELDGIIMDITNKTSLTTEKNTDNDQKDSVQITVPSNGLPVA